MRSLPLLLALLLAASPSLPASDTAAAAAARRLVAERSDAVVVVRATVSMTVSAGDQPSQSQDRAVETLGTVVSPDGLVIVSAAAIDPGAMADGRTVQTPGGPLRLSVVSDVKEVFIVLADGTELPAKVAIKDKDLNLALLGPVAKPSQPLVALDRWAELPLKVADEVVVLGRLGKGMERAPRADIDQVCAVISKPRPLAVIHLPYPGCPVLDLEGRLAGITSAKPEPDDMEGGQGLGMTPVVVPVPTLRRFLEAGAKALAAPASAPAPAPAAK
jgi:S1-C subfamily serine protease